MNGNIKRIEWIAPAILGCLLLLAPAQAVSFDCAKAGTKVEHIICDNPEISKMDDELAQSYKAALQDQTKAKQIKKEQKQWMKERNNCTDAVCVQGIYESRLQTMNQGEQRAETGKDGMIATKPGEQEFLQPSKKFRYSICGMRWQGFECEGKAGKGDAVCEAYLKHLQTLTSPPTCEAPIPPGFKQPDWEEMDTVQHLELAYQAEGLYLKKFGGYKHPDFDTWRQSILQEIKDRKINPRMRKAKITPTGKGETTILAYTRDRDACHKFYQFETRRKVKIDQLPADTPAWRIAKQVPLYSASNYSASNWINQGDVHFTLTDDTPPKVQVIVGDASRAQMDILLYANSAYLVQVLHPFSPIYPSRGGMPNRELINSPILIFAFDPRFPDPRPKLDLNHYLASKHCQILPY